VQLLQITCTRHTHKHPTTSKVVTTFILLIRLSTSTARPQSSSSTPGHSTLRTKSSKSACNEEGMENAARAQICEHRTTTGSAGGVPGACAIAARPAGVHGAEVATIITEADLRGEQPGESRSSNAVGMSGIGLLEPHVCTTKLCAHMIHAHAHACLATCALPLGSWPPPLKDTDSFRQESTPLFGAPVSKKVLVTSTHARNPIAGPRDPITGSAPIAGARPITGATCHSRECKIDRVGERPIAGPAHVSNRWIHQYCSHSNHWRRRPHQKVQKHPSQVYAPKNTSHRCMQQPITGSCPGGQFQDMPRSMPKSK
jgi:hypothetical protein